MTGGAEAAPPLTFHYAISFALHKLFFLQIVTLLKPIHTSAGINELLFSGKERMALGADFNTDIALSGLRIDYIAASTGNGRVLIFRMNILLHCSCHLFR